MPRSEENNYSTPTRKQSSGSLTLIGIVTALILVGIAGGITYLPQVAAFHDSPVEIGGGSIYASVGIFNLNKWVPVPNSPNAYMAQSSNPYVLQLVNFQDSNRNPAPSSTSGTGGWWIEITNSDGKTETNNSGSILFCTSLDCQGGPAVNGWVYVKAGSSARWEKKRHYLVKDRLLFHDTRQGCDASSDLDGPCNHLATITVHTISSTLINNQTYTCVVQDKCKIIAGQ
jgi:hypothetical protein